MFFFFYFLFFFIIINNTTRHFMWHVLASTKLLGVLNLKEILQCRIDKLQKNPLMLQQATLKLAPVVSFSIWLVTCGYRGYNPY